MKTKYKIYIARLAYYIISFIFGKKKFYVKRNEINWHLNLEEGIDLSVFLFGNFEKSIQEITLFLIGRQKLDIIDIGSNMGIHSLNLAKYFKSSKIYSLEPTDYAYNKLKHNLSLNPDIQNIFANQIFLTDGNTKPNEIYSSWNLNSKESKHVKHLGIKKSTNNSKIMSLDNFITQNDLNRKTLIKCDVDGHEIYVLRGGKNYLKKYKPYIVMELAPYLYEEYGYKIEDLINYLKSFNYKFYSGDNYNEITNILDYAKNIKDGSSENIFLM